MEDLLGLTQEWAHRLLDVPGRPRARRQTPPRRPPLQHKGVFFGLGVQVKVLSFF